MQVKIEDKIQFSLRKRVKDRVLSRIHSAGGFPATTAGDAMNTPDTLDFNDWRTTTFETEFAAMVADYDFMRENPGNDYELLIGYMEDTKEFIALKLYLWTVAVAIEAANPDYRADVRVNPDTGRLELYCGPDNWRKEEPVFDEDGNLVPFMVGIDKAPEGAITEARYRREEADRAFDEGWDRAKEAY